MPSLLMLLIGSGVRWLLTLVAAHGIFVSEDQTVEIISGVVAIAMLGWSWAQKVRADAALAQRR